MQINSNYQNNKPSFTGIVDVPKSVARRLKPEQMKVVNEAVHNFATKGLDTYVRVPLLRFAKKLEIVIVPEADNSLPLLKKLGIACKNPFAVIKIGVNSKNFSSDTIGKTQKEASKVLLDLKRLGDRFFENVQETVK